MSDKIDLDYPDLDTIIGAADDGDFSEIVTDVLAGAKFDIDKELAGHPFNKRVSMNDIVPQEYQNRLMQLDVTMSKCYWLLGDITTELINSINRKKAAEIGKVITNQDVFYAVGYFCHRSARSVRGYYEVAHFFPEEIRQKYEDVSFSTWNEARWAESPEDVLKLAQDNPDWSSERVRAEYFKSIGKQTRPQNRRDGEPEADAGAEMPLPVEGEEWSGASGRFKQTILARLERAIDSLREAADRIPLPTGVRVEIGEAVLVLQNISLRVRQEL